MCNPLQGDGSGSSLHHFQDPTKKTVKKNKSNYAQRKPSNMTSDPVKSQTTTKAIEAMKRKLIPEKEADTSRDNQKISRNEHMIRIHSNNVVLLCFFYSDRGLFSWTTKMENIIIFIIICKCFYLQQV